MAHRPQSPVRLARDAATLLTCAALAFPTLSGCQAPALFGGGGADAAHWCRLDDPAPVERERKLKHLAHDALGGIGCPASQPARSAPQELVLPMPCGRRMMFRKVEVMLSDALDSQQAAFGDPDAPDPYRKSMTGPWRGSVAGAFAGRADGGGPSYYYIGKYEVTAPQWAVFQGGGFKGGVGGGSCAAADKAARATEGDAVLPAVGVSFSDATAFADAYSRWLITYERGHGGLGAVVPNNESRPGYVRLPTEEEWEFAARGGDAGQTSGSVYAPAPGWFSGSEPGLSDIAWYRGVGQEPPKGASVYYVGRKAPNRLLTFDMVGNAEELVYDLFRPVRPDGAIAGRSGGAVARGGGAQDAPELVGVGVRREVELYDRDGPVAGPTTGLRLVVAAPFFVNRASQGGEMQGNPALRDGLTSAWTRRAEGQGSPGADDRNAALAALDQVRRAPQAPGAAGAVDTSGRLAAIQAQLQTASAAVAARDETTAQEQFLTAMLSAGYAREKKNKIADMTDFLNRQRARSTDPRLLMKLDTLARALAVDDGERRSSMDYYGQTIAELSRRDAGQLRRAEALVADRLERGGLARLRRWAPLVLRHTQEARGAPPSAAVLERLRHELDDAMSDVRGRT